VLNSDTKGTGSEGESGAREEAERIRVLLVDDHPLVRAGARAMLNDPTIEVVGEAATGAEGVELTHTLNPDVVLMDVNLPDIDGLVATAEIKRELPQVSVVIVTGDESRDYIRRAIDAGAAGYLMKGASREVLIQAVKLVQAGGSLIDAGLLASLAHDANQEAGPRGKDQIDKLLDSLSPREIEVLQDLARGMTNKEIAQRMHYSVGTVKNVVQRIIEKLSVSDRTQAAVYAVRAGLDVE
jgi:RNA polymerase sigma factor (sigma-70 family)